MSKIISKDARFQSFFLKSILKTRYHFSLSRMTKKKKKDQLVIYNVDRNVKEYKMETFPSVQFGIVN